MNHIAACLVFLSILSVYTKPADAIVLRLEDRFCVSHGGETLKGCRAEKFPTQLNYTAICPDPIRPDGPDVRLTVTDQLNLTMEGGLNCPRMISSADEVIFKPLAYRGPTANESKPQTTEPSEHIVRVLFGTNRRTIPRQNKTSYSGERDTELHFGAIAIAIPKKHDIGKIERPWSFKIPLTNLTIGFQEDPNTHFNIRWLESLSPKIFREQSRDATARSEPKAKRQAFIFIHGYNVSFEDAAYRTAQLAHDLQFDGAPILYSWPSRGDPESYLYDRDSIRQSRDHLVKFLHFIRNESGAERIHLVAHSMGNDLLTDALRDIKMSSKRQTVFDQVIFAAPDVAADDFLERVKHIRSTARGFTLYASSTDRALAASAFFGKYQRAGGIPITIIPGIDSIDVSLIGTSLFSLNHGEYADNSLLLNDMRQIIEYQIRPPSKRNVLLRPIVQSSSTYWQFLSQ